MKRLFLSALLSVSSMCLLNAQEPLLSVASATVEQGAVTNLSICLNNGSMKVNTVGFDLFLPEGMEFVLTDGNVTCAMSERAVDHTVSGLIQPNGNQARYLVMSMTNANVKGSEGVLFTTPVKVTGAPGEYSVMMNNIEVVDDVLEPHRIDTDTYFTITVKEAEVVRYSENQLYAKDITIQQGENALLQIAYNSPSDVYEYSADIQLPAGVTVAGVEFQPVVADVANFTNDWSFNAPTLKVNGVYGGGRRDVPADGGNTVFATATLNTAALAPGTYEITVGAQVLSNDDDDYEPADYVAYLTVEGAGQSTVALEHGVAYTGTTNAENVSLTYSRTFAATSWQPLYVPFNMSYDEWKDYADVAELACVHVYEDGRTTIEFVTLTDGELLPNVPYVIKPKATGAVTFECEGKTLKAAPADGSRYISCSSPRYEFRLYGNYLPISASTLDSYGPAEYGGAYIIAANNKFTHASESSTLKPFSFYIVRYKNENGYWGAPAVPFKAPAEAAENLDEILIMVDGEVCGIADILTEDAENGWFYNLKGQKVDAPQNGIYIHNGKKVIIK